MKKVLHNTYSEADIDSLHLLVQQAREEIGICAQDRGLECMSCPKRGALYCLDQIDQILEDEDRD